jgi:hypothetical protein
LFVGAELTRDFSLFFGPIRFTSAQLALSPPIPPPPRCRLSSSRCHHTATSCHASLPWIQDELAASASSFGNDSFRRLASQAETEALILHHCHRPPSTTIKRSSQPWPLSPPLNRVSVLPPP